MPTERKSADNEIYQIKVTLMRTAPPIWRRLLVGADITLSGLHDLLQLAMGWTNSHLHEFQFRGQCYATVQLIRSEVWRKVLTSVKYGLINCWAVLVQRSFTRTTSGTVGSNAVVLEKCLPVDPNMTYPACTGGRGACPPEDCGGVGGFYNLLQALQNPRHPEHKELLEWVGRHYDPEKFSIEATNRILRGKKRAARSSG